LLDVVDNTCNNSIDFKNAMTCRSSNVNQEMKNFISKLTRIGSVFSRYDESAAEHPYDIIAGKDIETKTVLPLEIVIRYSCGCYA
jgi:hypothetical protein